MIVDWETCDVIITCNWCNQLLNMFGMCNLKSRVIFWTQGGYYLKKEVENTLVEIYDAIYWLLSRNYKLINSKVKLCIFWKKIYDKYRVCVNL
jgi:hypothetical protein